MRIRHGLLKENASTIVFLQRLLDPTIAVGLLLALNAAYDVPFKAGYIFLAVIVFLLVLPIFKVMGLYHSYRSVPPTAVGSRLLLGWGIVLMILLFLGYSTKTSDIFSRRVLLPWVVSVPLLLYLVHLSIWNLLRRLRASGRNIRSAVIAGVGDVSQHLATQIHQSPYLGIRLLGFFDDLPSHHLQNLKAQPLLGSLEELPEYVRNQRIDVVYIALSTKDEHVIAKLISGLQDTTACVYFAPDILMFSLMQARSYEINGIPLIAVWEIPFSNLQYAVKRTTDIVVASLILALISPLLALIAIGVRFSSPGPILFKQRRYGLNGQEIIVYKFRSMKVMEDGSTITQAKRNDSRVTKIGAFLRRTSLDELPQFINVLQGRMSIVGPRPHAVAHNELYRKQISGYMLRHKVKPGITGWAQVHGLRGETDTLDKMKLRVEYDLDYLKNWSLALDLQIILRTAFVFFESNNAY
jgi:putative colanic acid biosynthesis UDP-glucose lipid carrier transferase